MRKRLKAKGRHVCNLCKPQKTGWESRWKPRELQALREWERDQRSLTS